MALLLTVDTPYGDATYWKAFVAGIDTQNDVASIAMHGYASATAKDAGKSPLASRIYHLTAAEITFTAHNITLANVYTYLKTLPKWEGAESDV